MAFGLRLHYRLSKGELADRVEGALSRAALWDEVKTSCAIRARPYPAGSSSACVSPGPWRWSPRSC